MSVVETLSDRDLFDLNTAHLKAGSSTERSGRELMSRTDCSPGRRKLENTKQAFRREALRRETGGA